MSVPQCSVPPEKLLSSAQEVGVACRGRGIVGHLSVDFITFIHPTTVCGPFITTFICLHIFLSVSAYIIPVFILDSTVCGPFITTFICLYIFLSVSAYIISIFIFDSTV